VARLGVERVARLAPSGGTMFYVQLLRMEAERYHQLASQATDPKSHDEAEDLAEVMEEVAIEVEEKLSGG
jgi:hypothetical protein